MNATITENEYKLSQEDLIIRFVFDDSNLHSKVFKDLEPNLFKEKINSDLVAKAEEFTTKHKRTPNAKEFYLYLDDNSNEKIKFLNIMRSSLDGVNKTFLVEKVESFIRNSKTYNVLVDAAQISFQNKLDEISPIVKRLQDAVNYKINTNIGLDAVEDIEEVLTRLKVVNTPIPSASDFIRAITGNAIRSGGFMRKALSLYLGQTNIGKTIHLCNDAAFAYMCGYNVLYVTLELAEEFILQRIYANTTGIEYNTITSKEADDIRIKLQNAYEGNNKQHGKLFVKEMKSSSTAMDIENLISQIKITMGVDIDLLVIDYIGKMKPVKRKDVGNFSHNSYTMGNDVAEQLRDTAVGLNIAVLTASQINREGYDSTDVSLKNTADSVGINNTADLMIIVSQNQDLKTLKMFTNIVIKNRFGPKDMQYLSKCVYENMKIRDASKEEQTKYIDIISQKEKSVPGFNTPTDMQSGIIIKDNTIPNGNKVEESRKEEPSDSIDKYFANISDTEPQKAQVNTTNNKSLDDLFGDF